ncbi:MAG: hypothetical protein M3014_14930 [Chloroflexota bacterium]|nr:hypothetical protein [Chloroflexota bacterium]
MDAEIAWHTIEHDLPALKVAVREILSLSDNGDEKSR